MNKVWFLRELHCFLQIGGHQEEACDTKTKPALAKCNQIYSYFTIFYLYLYLYLVDDVARVYPFAYPSLAANMEPYVFIHVCIEV